MPEFRHHNREEYVMSILARIGNIAARYSKVRSRYLTERTVRSLPFEIQKDIGWPDVMTKCLPHGCQAGGR